MDDSTARDLRAGVALRDLTDSAMVPGVVDGEEAILVRADGGVYALGGLCTHYHAKLCDGLLTGTVLRCPMHHAQYDVRTGEALCAPALDALSCWRVEQVGDQAIVRERIVPGKTLLVCQDYKYWGTYWVPMMMSRLRRYLMPVHNVLGATTVTFRLDREIPLSVLDSLEDHVARIPTDEGLKLINAARYMLFADLDLLGAANLSLCRVSFLAHQGKTDAARVAFKQAQELWPAFVSSEQLERARTYLREEKGIKLSRPFRFAVEKKVLGALQKLKGGVS
jgi:nitrite reductase/ring-hydroxylating ferredoxin subunit